MRRLKSPPSQTTALRPFKKPQSFQRKILLTWSLKIGLSTVALWLVFTKIDVDMAFRTIKSQNLYWLLFGSGLILAQILVGVLRWQKILRGLSVICSPLQVAVFYYISVFFNACLPGGMGGDVVRAWITSRATSKTGLVVNSIVLDRLATLAGLAIVVIFTEPQLGVRLGNTSLTWLLSLASWMGLFGLMMIAFLDKLPLQGMKLPVVEFFVKLGESFRQIVWRPRFALPTFGYAIATQICMSLSVYALAKSLNLTLSIMDCLVLIPPVALLAALPISLGGWGIREAAMVSFLGLVGVPNSAALILSIQFGLVTIAVSLPGGLLWLLYREGK